MLDDIYPIEISADCLTYEFKSIGPKGVIPKVVRYSEGEITGVFNLGFGDVDPMTGLEDDLVVSDNGDSKKILRTVASTLYTFTRHYPDSVVIASGSTDARTRLYQIGISTNLQAIKRDFVVYGYHINDWHPFELGISYEAFLVKRKL
jgi:hypothetical protein